MTLTDTAEEILETMWSQQVEGGRPHGDAALLRGSAALDELTSGGFVTLAGDAAALTARGREAASDCIRRHRLAERLMVDVLDLKEDMIHEAGCRFEHLLRRGLEQSICTLLGHPAFCPHGRPIPPGACCRELRQAAERLILRLDELPPGQRAQIAYLRTQDPEALQKLISLGALPGIDIAVLQARPTLVFQAGQTQYAVDRELASHVFVRRFDRGEKPPPRPRRPRRSLSSLWGRSRQAKGAS